MDWFLYDRDLRHERVNKRWKKKPWIIPVEHFTRVTTSRFRRVSPAGIYKKELSDITAISAKTVFISICPNAVHNL